MAPVSRSTLTRSKAHPAVPGTDYTTTTALRPHLDKRKGMSLKGTPARVPRALRSHELFKGGCWAWMRGYWPSGVSHPRTRAVGPPGNHYAAGTPGACPQRSTDSLRTALTKSTHRPSSLTHRAACATLTRNCSTAAARLELQFRGGTSRTRAHCRRKCRLHAEAAV